MRTFTIKKMSALFALLIAASVMYAQMPDAISISPETATADDEITLTLDPSKACVPSGKNPVGSNKICMHSGYGTLTADWQGVVDWNKTGKDGGSTELTDNGDGTWSIKFTPKTFYGIDEGVIATKICCVFNGCDDWASEAKDNDGTGGCKDFFVPIKFASAKPSILFLIDCSFFAKYRLIRPHTSGFSSFN